MSHRAPRFRRRLVLALASASAAIVPMLAIGQASPLLAGDDAAYAGPSVDRFIVKFRDDAMPGVGQAALQRTLDTAASRLEVGVARAGGTRGKALGLQHVRRMGLGADVIRSSRGLDHIEARQLMQELANDPSVEYVEVDQRMRIALTPDDPHYARQWHYHEAVGGLNLPAAWDRATGRGVVVAVLDTGYVAHSDLAANTVAGYDFISDPAIAGDGNGRDANPSDPGDFHNGRGSSWHGTHVAGTIAAVANNAKGVAGVAHHARVQHLRVLGRGGGWSSDIADAIVWASGGSVAGVPTNATPANVINLSLGGSGACGTTTQNAINGAVSRGTVVVVAAGNANADVSHFNPGNCNNVISVAATNRQGARASYSNYGTLIDVSAPGGERGTAGVLSTLNSGTQGPGTENYAYYAGTSMAAPHVAGVVALIQSVAPKTPAEIEAILKSTARPLPGACSGGCGAGIIDANAALTAALGGGGTTPPPPTGPTSYTNTADYQIRDNATVRSPITISGRTGNARSTATVAVNIVHTYIGDLRVRLIAPDGSAYTLHNRTGGSADNIVTTYTVNLSSELINGTWNLEVFDAASGDIGYINSWTITP
uniref:Serine protease n=1 Tax=uncultured organism TaxID=155900 RepID=D7GN86_9ZZZZ|nr:serine protease [uncultured organism]